MNTVTTKIKVVETLVRPFLEHAAPVWCPYLVKHILTLEKVQRRASRLALRQRRGDTEYEDRLKILTLAQLKKTQTLHLLCRVL